MKTTNKITMAETMIEPVLYDFKIDEFAVDLLTFRTSLNLTRSQFGKIVGCTGHVIMEVENNRRPPKVTLYFSLCEVMGKSIYQYLLK